MWWPSTYPVGLFFKLGPLLRCDPNTYLYNDAKHFYQNLYWSVMFIKMTRIDHKLTMIQWDALYHWATVHTCVTLLHPFIANMSSQNQVSKMKFVKLRSLSIKTKFRKKNQFIFDFVYFDCPSNIYINENG